MAMLGSHAVYTLPSVRIAPTVIRTAFAALALS